MAESRPFDMKQNTYEKMQNNLGTIINDLSGDTFIQGGNGDKPM